MIYDAAHALPPGAKIKVIGIGGGGGNAINTMIRANLEGVEFITANTDVQSIHQSLATLKIQLGKELTKGLGAGADPDIGRDAALEDRHAIQEAIDDADMVFITAGMGGGTGTGGASIVAQIARELGALTVAVVTKPFVFEGKRRQKQAEMGIQRLRESVDTLITIPNQRLLQVASPNLTMVDAFQMADKVLLNAVKGISDIINIPGTINVDFADVKAVMSCMGHALMGIGSAQGESRATEAARQAISSPLLEDVDIMGATGILINISAGSNVTLMEVNEACSIVQEAAHEDANIIFGAVIDENLTDEMRVTVIATGFPTEAGEELDHRYEIASPRKPLIKPAPRGNFERRSSQMTSSASFQSAAAPTPPPRVTSSLAERPHRLGEYQYQQTKAESSSFVNHPAAKVDDDPFAKSSGNSDQVARLSTAATSNVPEMQPLEREPTPELYDHDLQQQGLAEESKEALSSQDDLTTENSSFTSTFENNDDKPGEQVETPMPAAFAAPKSDFELGKGPLFEDLEFDFDVQLDTKTQENFERPGAQAAGAPIHASNDHNGNDDFAGSLDEKLDQALEMAEKLQADIDLAEDEDELLDIPAFLRSRDVDLGEG